MSALREVRLLIARHLELPVNTKASVLDVMNILDASLDAEGYEAPPEVFAALKRLEHAIIFGDDDLPEEIALEDALDSEDLVDIEIFNEEEDEEDDDET